MLFPGKSKYLKCAGYNPTHGKVLESPLGCKIFINTLIHTLIFLNIGSFTLFPIATNFHNYHNEIKYCESSGYILNVFNDISPTHYSILYELIFFLWKLYSMCNNSLLAYLQISFLFVFRFVLKTLELG